MMRSEADFAELPGLLALLCDDALGQPELDRLEQILLDDPDAQRYYARFLALDEELAWSVAGSSLPPVSKRSSAAFPGSTIHNTVDYLSSGWPVAYLVATVLLSIGILIAGLTPMSMRTKLAKHTSAAQQSPVEPKTEFVGRITGMVDCQWSDESTATFKGAHVPLGRKYVLASGLMEISYETGARVILQGPVTYEVESAVGGFLSVGKLTARVEKKEERRTKNEELSASRSSFLIPHSYFAVRTPIAMVTDLGTEFGVEVDSQGQTTSHVFRGKVEVQLAARDGKQGQTIQLSENESARVEMKDGGQWTIRNVAAASESFVRIEQLPNLTEEHRLKDLHRWQAYSQRLRSDSALVAYYPFDAADSSNTKILRNASAAGSLLDGQVEGAQWASGRLPGKDALYFHGVGSGDRVVLPESNRFNFSGPFSVAVWFKVARFTAEWQTLVGKGEGSWRLHRHSDIDMLGFDTDHGSDPEHLQFHRTISRTNVADGRWHLAVAVYEPVGTVARKRLYLDKRLEDDDKSPASLAQNQTPVTLGCNSPTEREFYGWIDEVAVLARVLSADEVAAMFRAGNPTKTPANQRQALASRFFLDNVLP